MKLKQCPKMMMRRLLCRQLLLHHRRLRPHQTVAVLAEGVPRVATPDRLEAHHGDLLATPSPAHRAVPAVSTQYPSQRLPIKTKRPANPNITRLTRPPWHCLVALWVI